MLVALSGFAASRFATSCSFSGESCTAHQPCVPGSLPVADNVSEATAMPLLPKASACWLNQSLTAAEMMNRECILEAVTAAQILLNLRDVGGGKVSLINQQLRNVSVEKIYWSVNATSERADEF